MPPAPLDERPVVEETARAIARAESDDSEDADDGFGPSLPPAGAHARADTYPPTTAPPPSPPQPAKPRRDAWMTHPPEPDDSLAARMDPTKPRARAFNTGKSAKGASASAGGNDSSAWSETPEQRQKRLREEVLGTATPAALGGRGAGDRGAAAAAAQKTAEEERAGVRRREAIEKTRGPSLMETHKGSTTKEQDDDPSARTFDREKDMGVGVKIGHSQRREMLSKAAGFSDKFAGGSFL
ncbi:hypothetical protein LTR08_001153 [Meristemomyces frigidus]|nr:hypothetical protein LTR08_001153 [Meristemomyces frigidus]